MMEKLCLLFVLLFSSSNCQHSDGTGLAIGGWGGDNTLEVLTSSATCGGASSEPSVPNPPVDNLRGWVAEYVDSQVLLCGGSDPSHQEPCYSLQLEPDVGNWTESGKLADARTYAASLVFNGEMVVMGGYKADFGWLRGVEKKTSGTETWEVMSEWTLEQGRFDFCAVQADPNTIIIAGGNVNDTNATNYTDSVQALDTNTGTWTNLTSLPYEIALHHCLRYDLNGDPGFLLTGGCGHPCTENYKPTLFFSFGRNTWQVLNEINQPRFGHKMTWINGHPAIVGGFGQGYVDTIELFEGESWNFLPQNLTIGRWGFGMPSYLPSSLLTC